MTLYYIFIFFILGTVFGSFYNVVGYRLPKEESIVYPPSHCPKCQHQLKFWELIPVLSYFFQGGKCTSCKNKISFFYPLFEFFTGFLFALSFYIFGFSIELLIALTFVSMALIIVISDYFYYIIPDEVLVVSFILFIIEIYFLKGVEGVMMSLSNGVIAFGIMYLIKKLGDFLFKKESMGGGDIKLLFIFGLVLGYEMAVLTIFLGSFIGFPISLIMLLLSEDKDNHIIPFGPFLCAGALLILFTKLDVNGLIKILIRN